MQAIRVHEYGGPEVMRLDELPTPDPGPGQVRVRVKAAGVNFMDISQRSGLYLRRDPLPFALGREGAGVVEAVGPDAGEAKVGDRVAWTGIPASYATHMLVPAERLVALPPGLTFEDGAAAILQGLTAHYLSHSTYPLNPGDTCLVHAAAGGVGLLLCQMAKRRGARVIGTVSSEVKTELARRAGANEIILYPDFEAEVKRLTGGRGVQVVYDAVGKDTFEQSLNCLAHRGCLVLYGFSSGRVAPFDLQTLNTKGSLFVTWPSLVHYIASRGDLLRRAEEVFGWVAAGALRLRIERAYPLKDAAAAHRALESRRTAGKLLLIP